MRESFRTRRDFLLEGFRYIGIKCVKPQGAFYAFPEVADEDAPRKLLNNGVISSWFGFRGAWERAYQDIVCSFGGEFKEGAGGDGEGAGIRILKPMGY